MAKNDQPAYVPIVVGVSGKRDLNGKEGEVRRRLDATFGEVEVRFSNSPLVLVTGLANGADMFAAEVALARERWTVIVLLPFDRELFLEDFPVESDERKRFEAILRTNTARLILKTLQPLRDESRQQIGNEGLHRSRDQVNELRRQHYEQLGLVIADRCTLLIAVMPGTELPDKIGGTARIAAFKRNGRLDAEAAVIVGLERRSCCAGTVGPGVAGSCPPDQSR